MPVTLAQAKLNVQDDIQAGAIEEFRKSSYMLDALTFDDAVSPGTSGATLTYGYTRVITESPVAFRAINAEYVAGEATKQRYTTDLKVFGGKFGIDRVLANTNGLIDEVDLQMRMKIKSAAALFCDTVINGDSGVDANAFDGLNKAVTGTSTEYLPLANGFAAGYIDLSSAAAIDANYKAFLDALDEFLSLLDGKPDCLCMNRDLRNRIRACARRSAAYSTRLNEFGQQIEEYNGIALIDLQEKPGSNTFIIQNVARDADGAGAGGNITNLTDLYACRMGLDGLHGVSMANKPLVQTWLPPFNLPGAVKEGEVEMVAAIALKRTRAAGVMRNIKVR
jgi:hypothetical protein